jgi:hypothetical protein
MPPQGEQPASKTMAIIALVLAVIGCFGISWVVSVVLAIIVLLRGKDGRAHGKGLAIAALVIDALYVLALVGIVVVAVIVGPGTSVEDLKTGDCVTANGLASDSDTIDSLEVVSCSKSHDGEVLATAKLSADDADGYNSSSANELCFNAINENPDATAVLLLGGISVIGLTESTNPDAGDKIACVAFNEDGSKLSDPLVE